MNYEQFLANAERALYDCREIKKTISAVQAALSAVPDMVRKNERLEKENAELKGELEILQCIQQPTGYMELPLDADGVAIRPGDKIYFNGDQESTALKCIAVGTSPLPVEFTDLEETGTTAWEDGFVFTHQPPNTVPPDSWEQLEEDAKKATCDYANAPLDENGLPLCDGCRFRKSEGCCQDMALDVLNRAKKLAGIEEEAER